MQSSQFHNMSRPSDADNGAEDNYRARFIEDVNPEEAEGDGPQQVVSIVRRHE